MVYLVSKNKSLFSPSKYEQIEFNLAYDLLKIHKIIQLDSETMGLDCHTKDLLTLQLGKTDNQVVFDWTTLSKEEKFQLKQLLESDILWIGHNIMFDLTFLYKQDIWPKKIYDTMIAEQLIYLGFPKALSAALVSELGIDFPGYEITDSGNYELSYSLKATAKRRINIDIDKTVRGKIINEGLTEDVVVYAAGDVMHLENIRDAQLIEIRKQDLEKALEFECEFLKSLAYVKFCGVKLDKEKWLTKMDSDLKKFKASEKALNEWVVKWDSQRHTDGDWDIRYPEMYESGIKAEEEEQQLIKNKYIRSPQDDLEVPYQVAKLKAYKKRIKNLFTSVNLQGDLFEGFNPEPQCTINWSSSQQVIKLFETLGINVETFDKKTKKKKKSVDANQIKPQKDKFPIIPIFLEYQEAAKVVSTYGQNWINAINPKTGRIHAELHSIGTDTGRISSGGGVYKVNLLNLPRDPVTRSCFVAEKGNLWVSADYMGQESALTASVAQDPAMIEILSTGGDLHSEVAKACWPDLLGNLTVDEIKTKYKAYRQDVKGVEFGIFYGGDDNTLVANKGFKPEDAKRIYTNFMNKFKGIKSYQDYCRKAVMANGYVLMNPILKHRAHIFDAEWLMRIQDKFKEDGFWEYYREMKSEDPMCDTVQNVRKYFKRKADSERQSINYRIQNRGACAFKLAMIKLFNYIIDNNLQNIVKVCVTPYDEINFECPAEMAENMGQILIKCMVEGGKPFCPNVFLGADVGIDDHWVH